MSGTQWPAGLLHSSTPFFALQFYSRRVQRRCGVEQGKDKLLMCLYCLGRSWQILADLGRSWQSARWRLLIPDSLLIRATTWEYLQHLLVAPLDEKLRYGIAGLMVHWPWQLHFPRPLYEVRTLLLLCKILICPTSAQRAEMMSSLFLHWSVTMNHLWVYVHSLCKSWQSLLSIS